MRYHNLKGISVAAILLAVTVLFYKDVIFAADKLISHFDCDIFNGVFSGDYLVFGKGSGGWPNFWNPYLFLGGPLISHPSNPLFYPCNIIFFLLPLHLAINYSFLLNTFLSGLAMYLYIRYIGKARFASLLGALVYMCCAIPLLHCYAGHLQTVQTFPWIPLLFLCVEMTIRSGSLRPALLGGVGFGIQLLAGIAQHAYYTILAVGAYFVFFSLAGYFKDKDAKRLLRNAAGCTVLLVTGLAVASVKLIPAMDFIRMSDRTGADISFAAGWSLLPLSLVTYIFPEFYGDMFLFNYWGPNALWEMCGYVGILPLILGLVAALCVRNKHTFFFAGLAAVFLAGALGAYTPLFKICYYLLPGFSKFRGHSKMMIIVAFSISVLAAYGISWLLERKELRGRAFRGILVSLGICAGLAALCTVMFTLDHRLAMGWWRGLWGKLSWPSGFIWMSLSCALFSIFKFAFLIVCGFLLLLLWANKRLSGRAFKVSAFALILFDLWAFGGKYIVTNNLNKLYWDRELVSFLKEEGGAPHTFRAISLDHAHLSPNRAILSGIHLLDGYDALLPGRYTEVFSLCRGQDIDSERNLRLVSLSNLKYIILPKGGRLQSPDVSLAYEAGDVSVWENSLCLPRAYIVHGSKVFQNDKEGLLEEFLRDDFDPRQTLLLEEDSGLGRGVERMAGQPKEEVSFVSYKEDEVVLRAKLAEPGYLVFSDANYPGWRAAILDAAGKTEREVKILQANYLFRAVALSKGEYLIRFRFRPVSFYLGAIVSLISLAAVALIVCKKRSG